MFTLHPLTIVLPSKEDKDHPAVDLDLHLPFFCFRPQQLLQVSHTPAVLVLNRRRPTGTLIHSCPCLCRCCLVSCRNSGWCYFLLTGPNSHWWQRACCFFCRSVENISKVNNSVEFEEVLLYLNKTFSWLVVVDIKHKMGLQLKLLVIIFWKIKVSFV